MNHCFDCQSSLNEFPHLAHKRLDEDTLVATVYSQGAFSPRVDDRDELCSTVAIFGKLKGWSDPRCPPNPTHFLYKTWMDALPEKFEDFEDHQWPSWEWYEEMMSDELDELAKFVGESEYPGVLLNLHYVDYGGGHGVKVSVKPYKHGWDRGGGQIGWVRSAPEQIASKAYGDRDRALSFITEDEIPRLDHWVNNRIFYVKVVRRDGPADSVGDIYPEPYELFPSADLLDDHLRNLDLSDAERERCESLPWEGL